MPPMAPPQPPGVAGATAPQPQMPSLMSLTGMGAGAPSSGAAPQMTSGMSQISETVVRMAAEIDQALKLLAQSMPTLAPWVEKVVMEMRYQVGTALQSGAMPTNPTPMDQERFPDGGGRI